MTSTRASVNQQISVRRDGSDVILRLSGPAAIRLAASMTGGEGDVAEFDEVARLLVDAAGEHHPCAEGESQSSEAVLLPGHWSSDPELDAPLPFTERKPLETISPGLVGVWRTRMTPGRAALAASAEPGADARERLEAAAHVAAAIAAATVPTTAALSGRVSGHALAAAEAALAARVGAAAKLLEETRGDGHTEPPDPAAATPGV